MSVSLSKCTCKTLIGVAWCPFCIGTMTRLAESMQGPARTVELNPFPAPGMIGQPTTPLIRVN
jgi:hypothetical protein